jgi:predicted transcriptional regulator
MSARDRIIALLRTHPDGLDDDVIAEKLGLSRRQQANSRCRELERDGIVER